METPTPAGSAGRGGCGSAAGHERIPHSATAPLHSTAFALPVRAEARLHITPIGVLVCIAAPPMEATPGAILSARGTVSAFLPHVAGCTWPDAMGQALAAEALAAGGGVILGFARLADAIAAHRRLVERRP